MLSTEGGEEALGAGGSRLEEPGLPGRMCGDRKLSSEQPDSESCLDAKGRGGEVPGGAEVDTLTLEQRGKDADRGSSVRASLWKQQMEAA